MQAETADGSVARKQFERLIFFSDAVFAIAITLLVLDLKSPAGSFDLSYFNQITPKLLGFGISFFVIGLYWIAHHQLFGTLRRENRTLLHVNLLFLASIVFLPFPTSIIADSTSAASVTFYAMSVAAVGVLLTILTIVARRPSLMHAGETRGGTIELIIQYVAAPTVFLLSTPVSIHSPVIASLMWILVLPANLIAGKLGAKVRRKIDKHLR